MSKKVVWGSVNEDGSIHIPPEIIETFGLKPGARFRISMGDHQLTLNQPVNALKKVYVEPTNRCNLNCTTCIRNAWDEHMGMMAEDTFQAIMKGLDDFNPKPIVFFGGWGEPLMHPKIIDWVAAAHAKGARVELISNATLLDKRMSAALIQAGLDMLWVSIDGATPEHYADIRLGAELPQVIQNVRRFKHMRRGGHHPHPTIGISFVVTRENIPDLPKVMKLARSLGASHFNASNIVPHTEAMLEQSLMRDSLKNIRFLSSAWLPKAYLPRFDLDDEETQKAFIQALNSGWTIDLAGHDQSNANDICVFIANGSTSIAWDGGVSPCWPLMHTNTSYLHNKPHISYRHVVGFVHEIGLKTLWEDSEYVEYRRKVQDFSFAPCTFCGGCELSLTNEDDCLYNGFPACGSCLWSQGVIHCP